MSYIEQALLSGAKKERVPAKRVLSKARYEIVLLNQKGRFKIIDLCAGGSDNDKVTVWIPPLRNNRSSSSRKVGLLENMKGMGFAVGGKDGKKKAKTKAGRETLHLFHKNYCEFLSVCPHPAIKAVLGFLGDPGNPDPTAQRILSQLAPNDYDALGLDDTKINNTSLVLFRYKGKYIHEVPEVVEFFLDQLDREWDSLCPTGADQLKCCITGKTIKKLLPPTKSPKAVGEYKLWSAKKDIGAYQHYGKTDTLNFSMERWVAYRVAAYVQRLLAWEPPNPQQPNKHMPTRYVSIGDSSKVCFWTAQKGTEREEDTTLDVTRSLVQDGLETLSMADLKKGNTKIKRQDADNPKLVRSLYKSVWQYIDPNKASKKLDTDYFMATFEESGKRGTLLDFKKTTFQEVQENIAKHCADMYFVTSRSLYTGKHFVPSLQHILKASLNPSQRKEAFAAYPKDVPRQMFSAAITGESYPISVFNRAVNRNFKSLGGTWAEEVRMAFIKAYITRERRNGSTTYKEVGVMMDTENTNVGYLLGRYIHNVEYAQEQAYGKVNVPISNKYNMPTTPRSVFPLVQGLFDKYTTKIKRMGKYGMANLLKRNVEEILDQLCEDDLPKTLNNQDRIQYCFGRVHERTYRIQQQKEVKEAKANNKSKAGNKTKK